MRDSGSVSEAYERWNKQFRSKGLFEPETNPYGVEFRPLIRGDLQQLEKPDGNRIYHQFLEILRHNIVSDKGNAFNKIFNLFLCKILDEDRADDEELEFQWLEGRDTPERLMGRLNNLYKDGMQKYLSKDITDYDPDDIELNDEKIKIIINELRLYKNQEFAFVDVFNEESFHENAKIVIEMVKLLQGWQIRYTHKQQFLGEFFELLLNAGFKQESGQFFTPVPLVRFILKCLPINSIISQKVSDRDPNFLPYVIDFACGSGHFLTETMDIINEEIKVIDKKSLAPAQIRKLNGYLADEFSWAKEYIYGIEKDYRLSKTSKLASFLNGDGDAVIVHASGIERFESDPYIGKLRGRGQYNESFDILVSNPPYAVKGFKSTVENGENSFSLYSELTDASNEIEVLFIERMAQMIKPSGVAGIILPLSILNNSGIYENARKLIFENFHLKGIAILGNNAFLATGINTVILFMQKRNEVLMLDCKSNYKKEFEGKNVVLVNSLGKDVEKAFLGYEFSNRRGNEGINVRSDCMLFDDQNLFSERHASSYILKSMLGVPIKTIHAKLQPHIKVVPLESLFDWEGAKFSNAIVFTTRVELEYPNQHMLVSMMDCISQLETGKRPRGGVAESPIEACSLGGEHIDEKSGRVTTKKMKYVSYQFRDEMKQGHIKKGDILICKDGAKTGKCAYFDLDNDNVYCANEHLFVIKSIPSKCDQKYLFYFAMSSFFQKQVKVYAYNKKGQPGLNRQHIEKINILLLPLEKQKEVVSGIDSKWHDSTKPKIEIVDSAFEKVGLVLKTS